MADLINLRQVRKRKARADKDKAAEANRHAFGRTRAEKTQSAAEAKLAARRLEGHKRGHDES